MIKADLRIPRPISFKINPNKLTNPTDHVRTPKFRVSGVIQSDICVFNEDFIGFYLIEDCDSEIRSVDLQMIRVEKIEGKTGKY